MSGRRREGDDSLRRSVELAARDLSVMRDEVDRLVNALGWGARRHRLHLESLIRRLDNVIAGLTGELMAGPDPEAVRLYVRIGRRALQAAAVALVAVLSGVGEGAGVSAYEQLRQQMNACEADLAAVDVAISSLGSEGTDPDEPTTAPPIDPDRNGFSGREAADLAGITYRQLDYWARTNLVRPSAEVEGESRRLYTYRDVLDLLLVKTMLDSGIRLEAVRDGFDYIRSRLDGDWSRHRLVIGGSSAVLVGDDEEMVDVVNGLAGQGVLSMNLLDLGDIQVRLDTAVEEGEAGPFAE